MKKHIILGLIGLIGLASCSNNNEPPNPEEKVKVQFNVAAFGVDVMPMSRATAKEALSKIVCAVYDHSTYQVTQTIHTPQQDGEDFGKVTLWLAPGTYRIGFIGDGKDGTGDNKGENATEIRRSNYGTFNGSSYDKDAFGFEQDYSIKSDGSIDANITLQRYVGKLCIQLDGELPNAISRVETSFEHRLWVNLNDRIKSDIEGRNSVTHEFISTDGVLQEYTRYITPGDVLVTFTSFDDSGNEISSMQVNIKMYANKRTIIKGKATNLLNQTPFEITVNDSWDDDVIVPLL